MSARVFRAVLLYVIAFACTASATLAAEAPKKVFRSVFLIAETEFDPAKISDTYSNAVIEEILESPLTYDMLARPARLKPQTLMAMPAITESGKVYTLKLKPGIIFADDSAFNGKRRELTAQDYVYSWMRLLDPKLKSPNTWLFAGKIVGLDAVVAAAKTSGSFDYDAKVAGLEVLDAHMLRITLTKPDFNFIYILAMPTTGAMAREVVEKYGAQVGAHPVGTGAFLLKEWRRSSKIVLEKNPNFREEFYDADPGDDPVSQKLAAQMKGKRLPQLDRIEISIIEESQPRWLAFLSGELDTVKLPYEFNSMAMPGGKIAPNLAQLGMTATHEIEAIVTYTYFNMKDPIMGGYTPDKVALRRAISLGYDTDAEINIIRNGNAIKAESPIPPGVLGYDPHFTLGKTYDPARAKALLDTYGYIDRDGDGYREMPDGKPLIFVFASTPVQLDKMFLELWKKNMDAIGIRINPLIEKWPDLRKKSKLGQLQTWALAWSADYPDGENFLQLLYGPNSGSSNDGNFSLPAFDKLYEAAAAIPAGLERTKIYQQMAKLIAAYAPWKLNTHRTFDTFNQPWVLGFRKHQIMHDTYKFIDIDLDIKAKAGY